VFTLYDGVFYSWRQEKLMSEFGGILALEKLFMSFAPLDWRRVCAGESSRANKKNPGAVKRRD
jgi:hypothetical protein